ncbi:hypothetical protein [Nocardiopsis ganjiahuensis]|uniref:hypothetical protein n=1 Tax=Nocardiopsis ganjiahuensis TaxID=239984 RepID=UPI000345DF9B|nr:hypothetical protein [Nocardiopsis ganjiahuensis]
MARRKITVELHHPKANRTYQAPPSAVPFWESKGWKRVDTDTGTSPARTPNTAKAAEKKES